MTKTQEKAAENYHKWSELIKHADARKEARISSAIIAYLNGYMEKNAKFQLAFECAIEHANKFYNINQNEK